MTFKVEQDCDYVQGHLRYGHKTGIIEVDTEDELIDIINDKDKLNDYMELIVDDYEVEDYDTGNNPITWSRIID